ncbi:MAG: lipoprotein [Pseudomonadota bacterium]
MDKHLLQRLGIITLLLTALAACGQKGPLYLPDAPSDVVTRPAATPPGEAASAPNSPQTADTPSAPASPAPEVTAPVGTPESDDPKKQKGATPPPQ